MIVRGMVMTEADRQRDAPQRYRCISVCGVPWLRVATFSNTGDGLLHETVGIDLPKGVRCIGHTGTVDLRGDGRRKRRR